MSETVLIVDDNDAFRRRAEMVLRGEGFDVLAGAADGASGLSAVRELRPDIALVDVGLPDTTGLEVARTLRLDAPQTAVILISTCDARDLGGALGRSGAAGFLSKSDFSGAALRDALLSRA